MNSDDSSYDVELVRIKAGVRDLAAFAHLTGMVTFLVVPVFVPLVIWLAKRRTASFVAAHAKEALNFQINILVIASSAVTAGCYLETWIRPALGLSLLLTAVVLAYGAVMAYHAGRIANQGKAYRYPAIVRLLPDRSPSGHA